MGALFKYPKAKVTDTREQFSPERSCFCTDTGCSLAIATWEATLGRVHTARRYCTSDVVTSQPLLTGANVTVLCRCHPRCLRFSPCCCWTALYWTACCHECVVSPDQERSVECPAAVSSIPGTAGRWSVGLYDPGSQLVQVTFPPCLLANGWMGTDAELLGFLFSLGCCTSLTDNMNF